MYVFLIIIIMSLNRNMNIHGIHKTNIYRDSILHYTYTLQTKGLILQYKFYGSSTDDPARDRSARALARIKVRLSLPYNRQVAWDLEQFPLVARREARRDKVCMALAPQHP